MNGFPDAIEAEFPKTMVQLCLAHMMRHRWNSVGWKQREEVATGIRLIYTDCCCLSLPISGKSTLFADHRSDDDITGQQIHDWHFVLAAGYRAV